MPKIVRRQVRDPRTSECRLEPAGIPRRVFSNMARESAERIRIARRGERERVPRSASDERVELRCEMAWDRDATPLPRFRVRHVPHAVDQGRGPAYVQPTTSRVDVLDTQADCLTPAKAAEREHQEQAAIGRGSAHACGSANIRPGKVAPIGTPLPPALPWKLDTFRRVGGDAAVLDGHLESPSKDLDRTDHNRGGPGAPLPGARHLTHRNILTRRQRGHPALDPTSRHLSDLDPSHRGST